MDYKLLIVAISNLYDFTLCSIQTDNEDVFGGWSRESPVTALPYKICFGQIGRVFPELRFNDFSYVNLQWLTNAE